MRQLIILIIITSLFTDTLKSQGTRYDRNYIPDDFPSDYIVLDYSPSCINGYHYFFKDSSYIFVHGDKISRPLFEIGYWNYKHDTLIISIFKIVGLRTFGEPTNYYDWRGADCPQFKYPINFNSENWVDKQNILNVHNFIWEDCFVDTSKKASSFDYYYEDYYIDGDFKVASCRLLNSNDLKELDKNKLRLMRNEIFARYGYKFKSNDLNEYFSQKHWYKPEYDNVEEYLSDIEKKNCELIKEFEKK